MAKRDERLLEAGCRLAMGRPCESLGPGLSQICHRLLPYLSPERVMGELFDVLGQAFGVERFERFDDPCVERSPAILKQTPKCHVVRQGVPEGVLDIREEFCLVKELGGLKVRQT